MSKLTVFYDHIRNAIKQESMTLEEVAQKLTAAGISGVEADFYDIKKTPGLKGLLKDDGKKLVNRLNAVGLPISCIYCNFRWDLEQTSPEYVDYKEVLETLQKYNIHNLLAIPGFVIPKDGSSNTPKSVADIANPPQISAEHLAAMEKFLPLLTALCKEAPKYGVTVLMEDYDNTIAPFGTSSELHWFFDRIPELGCAFDTGNFYYHGEDAYEVLSGFTSRIKYVHCKDRSLTPVEGEGYITTVTGENLFSTSVGSGIIPMDNIVKDILATGYDGVWALEHFGSLKQLEDMVASAKYMQGILK